MTILDPHKRQPLCDESSNRFLEPVEFLTGRHQSFQYSRLITKESSEDLWRLQAHGELGIEIRDRYLIPKIEDLFARLAQRESLDLSQAYTPTAATG